MTWGYMITLSYLIQKNRMIDELFNFFKRGICLHTKMSLLVIIDV